MKLCTDVPEVWEVLIRDVMRMEGWDTVLAYIRDMIGGNGEKDLMEG